jgi:glycosyltransferase involved in cell wall biosynthesis
MSINLTSKADVCLILEGTYPYVSGGVSSWTHELITRHSEQNFHLMTVLSPTAKTERKYDVPNNVVGITDMHLQQLSAGRALHNIEDICHDLEQPLLALTSADATLDDFADFLTILRPHRGALGYESLLNSEASWELLQRMYNERYVESSFLDYFWSWRGLMGSLFSIALCELPVADVYHTLSTGYAGMLAARAKIETKKPVIVTEHGIYTNERRIEVASADWLEETASKSLTIDKLRNNLRDFWSESFSSFSRICYEASDEIITLYKGNQRMQIQDGAPEEKLKIIPNGVNIERFAAIEAVEHEKPTIALIGRVVPIKDIKSFIRAISIVKETIPDARVYIMGPTDENIEYYQDCRQMIEYMGLSDNITFTGQVKIDNYLPQIDVTVISSISEAMPLVILEAGACGIPTVATDVGACRDLILGADNEEPMLDAGGIIVSLANATALAEAMLKLLRDQDFYRACSQAMRERVKTYYNKQQQIASYTKLYEQYLDGNDASQVSNDETLAG